MKEFEKIVRYRRMGDSDMYDCAEVGDIVRCRDCKWYVIAELKKDYTEDKRYKPSVCINEYYAIPREESWYCADGERKEGDNT